MIPVLLGVLMLVFTINYFTPGDPVVALIGTNYTQEQYDALRAELGIDQPFFVQFFRYVFGVVTRFDLGTSFTSKRAVSTEIGERFFTTLRLGLLGTMLSVNIGIPLGVTSATHHNSPLDYSLTTLSLTLASIPSFWLALMSIMLLSFTLKWLPASGLATWKHWVLPVACLGLSPMAGIVRMTRSSMLEVIRQDYIRTAQAKGLSRRTVVFRHALKNALIPVVTVIGMQMGMIMGGSILVETIFSIPGLGSLLNSAISNKNYPVLQGVVLVISISVSVLNLLVDVAYAYLDPRIKSQFVSGRKKKVNEAAKGSGEVV